MNKGGWKGSPVVGLVALVLTVALIVGGTTLFERRQLRAQRAELETLEAELGKSHWTDRNTVLLNDDLYGFDHRIESYLFIGTDADTKAKRLDSDYHSVMADFILLMVMDHTDDTYGFIQIDRNTVTPVDEMNQDNKVIATRDLQICTAQWYGLSAEMGAQNTVNAVRDLLGYLEVVDGYYEISMKDIAALNRAVGGVEIHFDEDLTVVDPAFKKDATVTLTDAQAEAFLRARMSVGEGTNEERMSRQRQYMDGLFAKVREHTRDNPKYGVELFKSLRSIAVTNMIGNDFSRIAQSLLKDDSKGILRFEGETKMGSVLGDGKLHEEFYPSTDSLIDVMTQLYSLVLADDDDADDEAEESEDDSEDDTEEALEEDSADEAEEEESEDEDSADAEAPQPEGEAQADGGNEPPADDAKKAE